MTWWQNSVAYAIFPLSFQDSDGDGYGDINGITARLDYLQWLGVDLIWLGPLYKSPLIDAGYDISGFTDIDPRFGTIDDFDRMVDEMHRRGMKLVMDFVLTTPPTSIRGSSKAARRAIIQSETGTSGATGWSMGAHQTIGSTIRSNPPGPGTRAPGNGVTICSCRANPTSTCVTKRSSSKSKWP